MCGIAIVPSIDSNLFISFFQNAVIAYMITEFGEYVAIRFYVVAFWLNPE